MSSLDETPTFNLKAVVQETGLKPDTLRAWERRYSLPQPARSPGGHRLYSQRDIDILKWLIARQEEGLSISRAVDLWNQLLEEGKDPFWEMAPEEEVTGLAPLEVGDTLTELRQTWIEACLEFDEQQANYVLSQAFALYRPETVCFEILQKGLSRIGELWYEGEATVQQEHFASALALRRLEALLVASAPPTRTGRILIGCPPHEEHTFAALLLSLVLRRRGWHVIYLGANVPLDRLQRTIQDTRPNLVIQTAQTLQTAASMARVARLVQEENITFAFGGLIFNNIPELAQRVAGHYLGAQLRQAPERVEQLMASPGLAPTPEPAPEYYEQALSHFQEREPYIETYILEHASQLSKAGGAMPAAHLNRANRSMAQGIVAALTLGDLNLFSHDLTWVEGLLQNHDYPIGDKLLLAYVRLYHEAAAAELDTAGQVVVDWLGELLRKETIRSNGQ